MGTLWRHASDGCGYVWERRDKSEPCMCPHCRSRSGVQRVDTRTVVPGFSLQPTSYFPNGAPQREAFDSDEDFKTACRVYADEWRRKYVHGGVCKNRDCPQCWAGK